MEGEYEDYRLEEGQIGLDEAVLRTPTITIIITRQYSYSTFSLYSSLDCRFGWI